nr:transposase [Pseudomonas aeruginosa]
MGGIFLDRILANRRAGDCAKGCARLRSLGDTPLLAALTTALRLLGKCWLALAEEVDEPDKTQEHLTRTHAICLRGQFGIGAQSAATLLAIAGNNPERLRNEAALAALCGVSPLQASSGKTVRHRLNRGSDRSANRRPEDACLRGAAYSRGLVFQRDPALPEALHRQGNISTHSGRIGGPLLT